VSDESGEPNVYVRPFPGPGGGKRRVSAAAAVSPRWSHDGKELYFRHQHADRPKLMAVAVDTSGPFRSAEPLALFDDPFMGPLSYDIAPDGRRFLFVESPPEAKTPTRLILVPGWSDELRAKLRASGP
jgi:Tol biopolymer transport system component